MSEIFKYFGGGMAATEKPAAKKVASVHPETVDLSVLREAKN